MKKERQGSESSSSSRSSSSRSVGGSSGIGRVTQFLQRVEAAGGAPHGKSSAFPDATSLCMARRRVRIVPSVGSRLPSIRRRYPRLTVGLCVACRLTTFPSFFLHRTVFLFTSNCQVCAAYTTEKSVRRIYLRQPLNPRIGSPGFVPLVRFLCVNFDPELRGTSPWKLSTNKCGKKNFKDFLV
ncbi:uncharacterized protein LOC122511718 isoform X2 [Leptopilina heterotoma]|uniref:uncharacterized protein LOC122511718 isoform X2 n=1 Tax=Leptopilina heterotoma TaxID=63436 RepID=UPI001CA93F14|nr:uncharacterized protein LOC122511718 isoform X2 [Leptopilina heterotoma]